MPNNHRPLIELNMANVARSCLSGFLWNMFSPSWMKRTHRIDARLFLAGRAIYDRHHTWLIFFSRDGRHCERSTSGRGFWTSTRPPSPCYATAVARMDAEPGHVEPIRTRVRSNGRYG